MNDVAAAGSVAEKPAGAPAEPNAALANGSDSAAQNPLSGLSEGARSWVEKKGYKSTEDIANAALSLEQKFGSMLEMPKPDATPEEWTKFYSRAGRPESPDKYEFKRPENLAPDALYSDDLAKAAKPWMHKAGLNPKQAQVVHDEFVGYMAEQQRAQQARIAQAVEQTHETLVKDWGGPTDSEAFKTKHALADRAAKKLGIVDDLKGAGILLPDGSLTNPQIAKALSAIGEAMFREDTIDDKGSGGGTGDNPFKRDANGKIKSISAMTAQYQSDPSRASSLAKAAGWSDAEFERWFQPSNPR